MEWSVDEKIDWIIYSGVFEYSGDDCDDIAGIDRVCNRENIRLGFVCCVDRLKSEVWGSVESIFEYNAVNTFEVKFCISKNQPKIRWIGMISCYIRDNAKNRSSLLDDWKFRLADD